MRILLVNSVCGIRSTGRICAELAEMLTSKGNEVRIAYGREEVPEQYQKYAHRITTNTEIKINGLLARIFDNEGLGSRKATERFIKWADDFDPDLVWLHNIHGYYLNYDMLFDWIKSRPKMQVKWTLHDCWALTGHCGYFDFVGCEKWTKGCFKCPQKMEYPKSLLFDNSKSNYERKKRAFTGVNNMVIITPSEWLKEIVSRSFLGEYTVEVVRNTIDTITFKPTISNIKERLGIGNRKVLLGVASAWGTRKGLGDFYKLANMVSAEFCVVLVGLTEKQLKSIPNNILGITRTNNKKELAELYSASEVFLNLTYEDNYPTVNLEAEACGTPVITYRTGGSVESVPEENIVEKGDLEGVVKRIYEIIDISTTAY